MVSQWVCASLNSSINVLFVYRIYTHIFLKLNCLYAALYEFKVVWCCCVHKSRFFLILEVHVRNGIIKKKIFSINFLWTFGMGMTNSRSESRQFYNVKIRWLTLIYTELVFFFIRVRWYVVLFTYYIWRDEETIYFGLLTGFRFITIVDGTR